MNYKKPLYIYTWQGQALYEQATSKINDITKKVTELIQRDYEDFDPHIMKVKVIVYPGKSVVFVRHLNSNLKKEWTYEGFIPEVCSSTVIEELHQEISVWKCLFKKEFDQETINTYASLLYTKMKDEQGFQLRRLTKQ